MGNPNSTQEEYTHVCLLLRQGREARLQTAGVVAQFPATGPVCVPQPEPSELFSPTY